MANKPKETKGVLVTQLNWPGAWAVGSTIQQARRRAGITKGDRYNVLLFNHPHWAVKDHGGATWAPDTEPPVELKFYKGEVIALTICQRGDEREGVNGRMDIDIMRQPERDCPEKDKTKGIVIMREQNTQYKLNEEYDGSWGQPMWMKNEG